MVKAGGEKKPDALHGKILRQLEALWKARGMNQGDAVVQQTVDKWRKGSSPTLRTLSKYARKLSGRVEVEIVDEEATEQPHLPVRVSAASVEIAKVVDKLTPEEQRSMVRTVHDLARTFRALRQGSTEAPEK